MSEYGTYYEHDNNRDDLMICLFVKLLADLSPVLTLATVRGELHLPEDELVLAYLHHEDDRVEEERNRSNHGAVVPAALSEHFYNL